MTAQAKTDRVIEGMAVWGSYYRENIVLFVEEYLGITFLKWFQKILLVMMDRARTLVFIGARGMGKSFLIALFAVCRCILYPGTKVVITSWRRDQSINVLDKIHTEFMPVSPNLRNEIDMKETRFSGQDAKIVFKNSSYIKVVTASDSARSNRANILIVDEFRLVKKDIVDTVLKKFLTSRRMPPYTTLTDDEKQAAYAREPNKSCYLSSGFFKDHWCFGKTVDTFKLMLNDQTTDFTCGLPYELCIQEGLLFPEDVESDMLEEDFNEIKWGMEMEAKFYGDDDDGSFFNFDTVSKNRRIQYPMLPENLAALLGNHAKVKIPPKQPGEKRILSADIALMASTKHNNDATAIFINQMLPSRQGRYTSNIVYGVTNEGLHTADQALIIRKLYEEYDCDYIVLDCSGLGIGIYDTLARDIINPDTGEIYPALSCCNNPEMAARCTVAGAEKVIWAIKGSQAFNSECAMSLREGFRSGKVRLLVTEYDAETLYAELKGYAGLSSMEKMQVQLPYVNTTLLINELVKLQHDESSGKVKIYERSGMRKDRYSSLSYNYYVAQQLEIKLSKRRETEISAEAFIFKPPKLK